jgi:hypothetical protein
MKEPKDPANVVVLDRQEHTWLWERQFDLSLEVRDRRCFWYPTDGPQQELTWKQLCKRYGPLSVYRYEETA